MRGRERGTTTLTDRIGSPSAFRSAVVHDRLALDLTTLANERTFLAYIRTALAFVAAGSALLSDFLGGGSTITTVGWVFIGLGVVITIVGIVRYLQVRQALRIRWRPESASSDQGGGA